MLESLRSRKSLRRIYSSASPRLQALMRELYGFVSGRSAPHFHGWLMATDHEHPWVDEYQWQVFRATSDDLKRFELSDPSRLESLDALQWRHWVVAYCMVHAVSHRSSDQMMCVEAGVEDGLTAFVALRELGKARADGRISGFEFHLYDAWEAMRAEDLSPSESSHAGKYSTLAVERTQRNLAEFRKEIVIHKGHLPETLDRSPLSQEVDYAHIDLNAAGATIGVCKQVWPLLRPGSVLLFDDYGWRSYRDTKEAIDAFLSDKPGSLLKLPTGQAIYFR